MGAWNITQEALRQGFYGPWHEVRQIVAQRMIDNGCEEIGSSDINHMAFNMVKSGELTRRLFGVGDAVTHETNGQGTVTAVEFMYGVWYYTVEYTTGDYTFTTTQGDYLTRGWILVEA